MYKIIGADGKEYGPITTEQLKQWVAEGRANAQTKVLADGATEWKTLAEIPELAAALPIAPSTIPAIAPGVGSVDQLRGPAVGLIVTAILGYLVTIAGIIWNLFGAGMARSQSGVNPEFEQYFNMFAGTWGVISGIFGLVVSSLILFGALKMNKLESHSWAMTASILALVPCVSPCCLVGLPIGIWSLVVLSKPEVKALFQRAS
jgi:uncharacterized membrane protein